MNLRGRILRAGAWTVASYAGEIVARFFSSLIMTRLLVPEAFGTVAAAMAIIVGLQLISDFGVKAVIIQSTKGDDEGFLKTAWTFQAIRGFVLWIVLVGICLIIALPQVRGVFPEASIYASPQFSFVAIALGIGIVLSGLESASLSLCVRRLQFQPIFLADFFSRLAPMPVMISWAYLRPSVWAIVAGTLAGGFVKTALSHLVIPGPRMSFSYNREHVGDIVSFGKWISLSSFATFIGSQSDYLMLGFLLPGSALGFYYVAKMLKDSIENLLERLNSMMTLPVLSEVARSNPANVSDRYYQFRLPIELLSAVSAGFLFESSDFIVHFLYDARYQEAGIMLKVLSISLFFYPFPLIRSAFTAVGEAHVAAWVSVAQAIALIAGLSIGYWQAGAIGGIAGSVLSRIIPAFIMLVMARRKRWIVISKEIRWLPAFGFGLAIGWIATRYLPPYTLADIRHVMQR